MGSHRPWFIPWNPDGSQVASFVEAQRTRMTKSEVAIYDFISKSEVQKPVLIYLNVVIFVELLT